jgi:glycosyltransferase involved in cell wall biosynthesis
MGVANVLLHWSMAHVPRSDSGPPTRLNDLRFFRKSLGSHIDDSRPVRCFPMNTPQVSSTDQDDLAAEVRLLRQEAARLSERLDRLEANRIFRLINSAIRAITTQKRRVGQLLLRSRFHPLYLRLRGARDQTGATSRYRSWVDWNESLYPPFSWHKKESERWRWRPVVSILLATYHPKREWLDRAIQSVKAQSYDNWELCICDDASGELWLTEYLETQRIADSRIKVGSAPVNGGISMAQTCAGKLATGELVTFLDHDDELHVHALHYAVEAFQEEDVDLVYTDEDHLDVDGTRAQPTLKPDWSPELLDSCMYFGHLLATRRSLMDLVGWLRKPYDGAQDYDLALRLVECAREIKHVPRILYHWRQHLQSTALNLNAKPYAHEAGKRALSDSVVRRQISGDVMDGPFSFTYEIRRPVPDKSVSIIVCSRGGRLLSSFMKNLRRTQHDKLEVVVVEHWTGRKNAFSRLAGSRDHVRVPYEGPFNFSDMNNRGVLAARSELLVFLNDDVAPICEHWLQTIVSHLEQEEIGIVGGKLLYPDQSLQHAGIAVGLLDGAGHPGRGRYASDLMYYLNLPHNVSAVTGACLAIRRTLFEELGGFDVQFPLNYNDVDLCLRARSLGFRILVDPRVEMRHQECASRFGLTKFAERERFARRWASVLDQGDPFYPQAFDRNTEEIRLPIR